MSVVMCTHCGITPCRHFPEPSPDHRSVPGEATPDALGEDA